MSNSLHISLKQLVFCFSLSGRVTLVVVEPKEAGVLDCHQTHQYRARSLAGQIMTAYLGLVIVLYLLGLGSSQARGLFSFLGRTIRPLAVIVSAAWEVFMAFAATTGTTTGGYCR